MSNEASAVRNLTTRGGETSLGGAPSNALARFAQLGLLALALMLLATAPPVLGASKKGAKVKVALFSDKGKWLEDVTLLDARLADSVPEQTVASGYLVGQVTAPLEAPPKPVDAARVTAIGDPSICYHVQLTNGPTDPSDPLYPEPDAVFFTVDLPFASVGAHDLSVDVDITVEDTNGDGVAFLRPSLLGGPLHRAYSFAGTTCCEATADVLGSIEAPGTYHFEASAQGGALGEGQLSLVMDVDLSPEDRLVLSGRVIQDDGSDVPLCEIPDPSRCLDGSQDLCVQQERFAVEVQGFADGEFFRGQTVPGGSADTGLFWFFDPENWELMTKVLDGCSINGHFWVLQAAVTDVFFETRIYDITTGRFKKYTNREGQAAPAIIDTTAFPCGEAASTASSAAIARTHAGAARLAPLPVTAAAAPSAAASLTDAATLALLPRDVAFSTAPTRSAASTGACTPGPTTLCLAGDRYQVDVDWRSSTGSGAAQVAPLGSDDSGVFFFFDANNWEMLVKVLDACAVNGHRWVFAAATTDVEYRLVVTDTVTGETSEYFNPLGTNAAAITDTAAFACQ